MINHKGSSKKLLIYGTGTIAEIACYYFCNDSFYDVIGFTDVEEHIAGKNSLYSMPVFEWATVCNDYDPDEVDIFVAVGYQKTNTIREIRFKEVKSKGFTCASYISTKASIFTSTIGENCLILENNVLQPFVRIGNNVLIWSGNHVGHHSVINDNVFIASQSVISGKCEIGKNSFLGVNSCLHDGIQIGDFSVVGAGSIVSESCSDRSVFLPENTKPRIIRRDII